MSQYAAAINQALGVQQPVALGTRRSIEREPANDEPRPQTPPRVIGSAVIVHSEVYRDFLIVVRELPGVTTISEPPPGKPYWSSYFTDDELKTLASNAPDVTPAVRARLCRVAIDRLHDTGPVWTGVWYERPVL